MLQGAHPPEDNSVFLEGGPASFFMARYRILGSYSYFLNSALSFHCLLIDVRYQSDSITIISDLRFFFLKVYKIVSLALEYFSIFFEVTFSFIWTL